MIVRDDKKCIPVTGKSMVSIITRQESIFEKISLMVKFFSRTSSHTERVQEKYVWDRSTPGVYGRPLVTFF